MRTRLFLIVALSLISFLGFRGYEDKKAAEAIWLEVSWPEKNQSYYIEIDTEGRFMTKEEKKKKFLVREGQIKKMYAKDFFRETKNSEVIGGRNTEGAKLLFYKGEVIKISAYINGELVRVEAPMKDFSDSFRFAFSEMKKEIFKSKPQYKYPAFLTAVPLKGVLLAQFQKDLPQGYKLKVVEIKKLKTQPQIYQAINHQYKLIPLKNEEEVSSILNFISEQQLLGMKSLFYLGTTRGNFQCSIVEPE